MPPPGTSSTRSLQARAAAARRWKLPDADTVAAEYATARMADYITRTVAAAPPLTDDQRQRLCSLLSGSAR